MASPFQTDARRYARLIADCISGEIPFVAESETPSSVQAERGTILPLALRGPIAEAGAARVDRLVELALPPASQLMASSAPTAEHLSGLAVIDRAGHHRPVYRALLVYCWLQAFRVAYETLPRGLFGRWEESLRVWCDLLEAVLGDIPWPAGGTPAVRGAAAAESAWTALALHVGGKVFVRDAWTDLAGDTFGKLARGQRDDGAFLTAGPSDNPETHWYHELVLLHAAASYGVQAEDRPLAAAVKRNTEYHLRETQPDHATAQPWGLFAFVWNEPTRPLADGLLHAAQTLRPENRSDGITSMLLADALYCLQLFEGPP